jgi:4-hydroxythreonine-4-phosphate dehydrogenase
MTKPLAVTMGEPAGIGGEVMLKAYATRRQHGLQPWVVFGDAAWLQQLARHLALPITIQTIDYADAAVDIFAAALPVIPVTLSTQPTLGHPDVTNAGTVIASITQAVQAVQNGSCSGIVTNPIQKSTLHNAGFKHPGHTEFLAELTGGMQPVMLLATQDLRVVPVTIHVPLRAVAENLSTEKIVTIASITAAELQNKLGITAPRLVVAALNPHAGEDGKIGDEEINIIQPAIARLRANGIHATGPYAADTLFHPDARHSFDCAICMYHDQALIPLKTLDFWGGVNVTLGLPLLRTSPDHGTALNIAGQNIANPASFINAVKLLQDMVARGST